MKHKKLNAKSKMQICPSFYDVLVNSLFVSSTGAIVRVEQPCVAWLSITLISLCIAACRVMNCLAQING